MDYTLEFNRGASLIEVGVELPDRKQVGGGRRGNIQGFSRASRLRLMEKMNRVRNEELAKALFITLTYPALFPSGRDAKRDLYTFNKRLMRKYPQCAGVHRIEFQERGAPHFHLVILGVEFIPHEWVAQAWYEIVGSGDPKHLAAGVEVRRVKNHRHAVSYVSKYLGKVEQASVEESVGRWWGVFGRIELYIGELVSLIVERRKLAKVARVLDKLRLASARRKKHGRLGAIRRAKRRRDWSVHRVAWFQDVESFILHLGEICGE